MKTRILLLTVALSAALFSILAFLVVTGVTRQLDESVLLAIDRFASPALDWFFVRVTELGGVAVVASIALLLFGYLLYRRHFAKALLIAVGVGGVALVNLVLKAVFERPRPDIWEWLVTESNFSFPSGHATATAALACCVVVLLWRTRWRVWAIIGAEIYLLVIGLSRLYLGVHYPTDILGGWLLGIGWVALVTCCLVMSRRHQKTGGTS